MSDQTFFSNSDMFNIAKNVSSTEILEFIKNKYPISIWDISKKLDINRNQLYYVLRNLEFAGVIKSKIVVNENNRNVRMIYYNKKQGGHKRDDGSSDK